MSLYDPTEQIARATDTGMGSSYEEEPSSEVLAIGVRQGEWHQPGWVVVAGRGVLVVVVVVEVVVVVGAVVVVVFAVVVFAVVTRCGRSYASKQREEVEALTGGDGGFPCQPVRLLCW